MQKNIIDINKKYRTRNGFPAIIYKIYDNEDSRYTYPIHGAIYCSTNAKYIIKTWTEYGKVQYIGDSDYNEDLVEVAKYDDIAIDAPVLVWNDYSEKKWKRHFAGMSKEGMPLTWCIGRTSFSADSPMDSISWENCIPYINEDII